MASNPPVKPAGQFDAADLVRKTSKQAIYERVLPRKFYTDVSVVPADGGHTLALDGKPVRTPMKKGLKVPGKALADAIADEWRAQEEFIDPDKMPITRLANTAVDRVEPRRDEVIAEIISFAGSDLLCYRAHEPRELVARQVEFWDPLLAWADDALGAQLISVPGVMHSEQPQAALDAVRVATEAHDEFAITGLHNIMTLTGSAILAMAIVRGVKDRDDAWKIAHVDEDWQIERWGEDEDAVLHRAKRFAEFTKTCQFIQLAAQKDN